MSRPSSDLTLAVGAGLLAMVVDDNACCLDALGAFESIASKPAPTGGG
ncbi:hypothetical protein PG5_37330 [Pseudomonas sp. G5(2012)]|nr:hypothetical protein PG5_37330 [Pseudomonas sp. G5(2012)]